MRSPERINDHHGNNIYAQKITFNNVYKMYLYNKFSHSTYKTIYKFSEISLYNNVT